MEQETTLNNDSQGRAPVAQGAGGGNGRPLARSLVLLKASAKFYKDNFFRLIGIMLAPLVLVVAGVLLAVAVVRLGSGAILVLAAILALATAVVTVAARLALIYTIKTGAGVWASYQYAFRNILSYFWLALLMGLVITGGVFMGLVPGIIFGVWFFPAIFIFVDLERKGMAALLTAKEYVRDYWWPVAGRLLLLALVAMIVLLLLSPFGFKDAQAASSSPGWGDIIAQIILTPFMFVYTWLLYRELVAAKPAVESAAVPTKTKGFFIFSAIFAVAVTVILFVTGAYVFIKQFTGPASQELNSLQNLPSDFGNLP